MSLLVIATTTFTKDSTEIRARLVVRTMQEAQAHNFPVIVVDGGSPAEFCQELQSFGAILLDEKERGMGPGRRQALGEAGRMAGRDGVTVWMEPEKWPLVAELGKVVAPIVLGEADCVVPSRTVEGLSSYPPEQVHAELLGNQAFAYISGQPLDVWFGPFGCNELALQYFLGYQGEYGDKWDSIIIPRLRLIRDRRRVRSVPVTYTHPRSQTEQETGNLDFLIKRIEQLMNLVPALRAEGQKLELGL